MCSVLGYEAVNRIPCWFMIFFKFHYTLVFSLKFSIKTKLLFVVKVCSEEWRSERKGIFINQQWSRGNLMEISLPQHVDLSLRWNPAGVNYSTWEKQVYSEKKKIVKWKGRQFIDYYMWQKYFSSNCLKIKNVLY